MKTKTQQVYVLTIHYRHGENTYTHRTPKGAHNSLFKYVQEWWPSEVAARVMPANEDEAIREYFERVEGEYYDMGPSDIED